MVKRKLRDIAQTCFFLAVVLILATLDAFEITWLGAMLAYSCHCFALHWGRTT
ncbi:hypothetical protein LJC60_03220 [Ruminococcaceae bacterium OttesenSCG-928-D13]|nr:hypothetical protein [Ruminococcaceae bacterium OttesenSCG-928-D13]